MAEPDWLLLQGWLSAAVGGGGGGAAAALEDWMAAFGCEPLARAMGARRRGGWCVCCAVLG